MLAQAAEALPAGLTLSVTEGYRPIQAQRAMHAYMVKEISNEHPEWNFVHVELEAGMRSAPPDAVTPPPHLTGGAVDVEILDEQGNSLDFSSPFGRIDWRQARTLCAGLSDTACANRKLLKSVMEPTGFTNYVDEWWHWSYGDNGWALRVNAPYAIYGKIDLPEHVDWLGDINKMPKL